MEQLNWQQHPHVPWIHVAPCGCQHGGFYVRDTRTGETVHAPDYDAVDQFAADRSRSNSHVPLGDMVHNVANKLGVPRCGDCARRQARLNNLWRR